MMFLYLWAISTGSYPLILMLGIITFGVVYSAANGVWPSFYGEMFSTRVRLSGMAIGTQIGFAVAGFAVTFAAQIAGPDGDDWSAVALFTAALCVPPVIAALSARETPQGPDGTARRAGPPGVTGPGDGVGLTPPTSPPPPLPVPVPWGSAPRPRSGRAAELVAQPHPGPIRGRSPRSM